MLRLPDPPGWLYFLGTMLLLAAVGGLPPSADSWQEWVNVPLVAAPLFAEIAFIKHALLMQPRTRRLQVLQILLLVPALVVLAVATPADFDTLLGSAWLVLVQLPLMWMVFRAARRDAAEDPSQAEAKDAPPAEDAAPAEGADATQEAVGDQPPTEGDADPSEDEATPSAEDSAQD